MLTVKRKADRAKLAAQLVAEMTEAGAEAIIEPVDDREIAVRVAAPGGAVAYVYFDGASSQPDVYVVTWNTRGPVFMNPDIGSVNLSHYGKASRVCYGFAALCTMFKHDVARFADGSAYMKDDHPLVVAMGERYKERGWQWPLAAPTKGDS